ncbi:28S ribosomal protein S35, mitochondrial isoform X2 [Cephus cinctus]|nr:28S ribosomal protein S35, mitochondrial isoform X2 [Cephus cinctus]
MAVDQDWPSVWPGPKTFHPAVVPIPIRQGYSLRDQPPPDKYGNTELMKIPNFLHLSPPAVQRHCEALKKFCTEWPVGLETEDKCRKHFPLEVITSDYCYSSPTIREPLSRIVTLRVKLSSLSLNAHAKDKILRLVKDKYSPETDFITITADRCPTKKQNLEYAEYLLTALFHESWRVEDWESEKAEADMEYYDWDKNKSRTNLLTLHAWPNSPTDTDWECIPHVEEYKIAVSDLFNTGEDLHTVNKYKEAVKNVLNLKCEA